MRLKNLLLGSVVALAATTGAKAADAVLPAGPEPVDYVRICDAYGAGFFYIPGTETCLGISGYVYFQVGANDITDELDVLTRARLNFDARSDTEWGTLRGFIRVQGTWTGSDVGDGPTTFDQAFIELGGLRMGYTESAWNQTQGGGATNWGSHSWGGMYYAYQQRTLLAYTFQGGNGFFGTLSLEDDANANYVPDVVLKAGVNQGWGSVWAMVGYDEDIGTSALMVDIDGWAAALGVQINVPNAPGSSLRVIGYYADNANAYSPGGSEWSILGSYNHAFSSTLNASVAVQYFDDFYTVLGGDGWSGEISVIWFPVTNFEVRTEILYDDTDFTSGTTSGFLRFTRYF